MNNETLQGGMTIEEGAVPSMAESLHNFENF